MKKLSLLLVLTLVLFLSGCNFFSIIGVNEYADVEVDTVNFKPNLEENEDLVIPYIMQVYTRNWYKGLFSGLLFFYIDDDYVGSSSYRGDGNWMDDQGYTSRGDFLRNSKSNYYQNYEITLNTYNFEPGEHWLKIRVFNFKPDDLEDNQDDQTVWMSWITNCAKGTGSWTKENIEKLTQCGQDYPYSSSQMINEDDTERMLFTIFKPEDLPEPAPEPECRFDWDCPNTYECRNQLCKEIPTQVDPTPEQPQLGWWDSFMIKINIFFNRIGINVT